MGNRIGFLFLPICIRLPNYWSPLHLLYGKTLWLNQNNSTLSDSNSFGNDFECGPSPGAQHRSPNYA